MTPNKGNYLKCIYEPGETRTKITSKRIAEPMRVSAPIVSGMVKKMIAKDLIVRGKGLGYYLTKKGSSLVSELYRKHRLIKVFLANHLHYNADGIRQEAEVLEHIVPTISIDCLEENLNLPAFYPHGGTIPKKGGFLVEIHRQMPSQTETLDTYKISRTHDEAHLLNHLEGYELAINDVAELIKVDDYAKTHTLAYHSRQLVIPERIAKQIYIGEVD